MTRRTALMTLCGSRTAWTQDEAVFRSAISLVRVDAQVSDAGGHILTELKKQDFRVFDEDKEQPIVHFSFEEEPLDVILLFDVGGSMRSKVRPVVQAVELGFHELRTGDRGCVMAFSANAMQLAPFTTDFGAMNEAILLGVLRQNFGGTSKLVQAATDATRRFRAESNSQRRRAILVITDKTGAGQPGEMAAVRDLWQADAVLSELVVEWSAPRPDALVEKTGGAAIATGTNPGGAFQESLRRLRRRYSLYYGLPVGSGGGEHRVRVELTAEFPGVRVFARTGYFAVR